MHPGLLHAKSAQLMLRASSVITAGFGGLVATGNAAVAVLASVATVIGVGLALRQNNRANRRERAVELAAAEQRGRTARDDEVAALTSRVDQLQRDMEFFRDKYYSLLDLHPRRTDG